MHKQSKAASSFRITSSIIDDHLNAEKLLAEFQMSKQKDSEAARRLFARIKRELFKHMAHEEEALFPLFEVRTGLEDSGPTSTLKTEHKRIRALLKDLEESLERSKSKKNERREKMLENQLLKTLKAHEEKEEEIFYPWLDQMLPEEQKEAAISRMGRF